MLGAHLERHCKVKWGGGGFYVEFRFEEKEKKLKPQQRLKNIAQL